MLICSVYDSKSKSYATPFFVKHKAEALRSWQDVVNKEDHPISKWPEDFTLFEIGTYDEIKGLVVPHDAKIPLGTALEYRKSVSGSDSSQKVRQIT